LKPGVTVAQANAELASVGARISADHPEDGGRTAMVRAIRDQFFGPVERPLFVFAGVVTLVLAIACANVAGLLLGRGSARRRDLALRRALGATRARLIRQLLTEATVLSCAGAAAGLVLAWWASASLAAMAPSDFIGDQPLPIDVRVLAFALGVSILCGLAFGAVPALQLSRQALAGTLSEGSVRATGSRRSGRTRDLLVAAEIAVAVVLLVGSMLFVRSFLHLTRVDVGLETRNLLTFDVSLTGERAADQARQAQFYQALQERLSRVPGVHAVGAAVTLPIGGDDFGTSFLPEGTAPSAPGHERRGGYQVVMPGYFAAMGIPLRAGRDVRPTDRRDSEPVVLVNERLAREAWPGQDPIGKRLRFGSGGDAWWRVIGVVGDIRHLGPAAEPRPEIYQTVSQRSFPFMAFVVRTELDPMALAPSIRRAVSDLDPALPLGGLRTMEQHVQRALSKPRFFSTLVMAFGALAVTLAVIGIYAMMAWAVSERRQEFAIRLALGAPGSSVVAMVLRHALILTGSGVAAGLVAAWTAGGVVAGMLYGIQPANGAVFVLTAIAVAGVALAACYVPARRALRVDPVRLLR
jgi:putative ABC transport system permease protein